MLNYIIVNGVVINFDYVGLSLVIEFDGNLGVVLCWYILVLGIDEFLVWYEGVGISDCCFIYVDEWGSVVVVINVSGVVLVINIYDEFGIFGIGNFGCF